MSYVSRGLKLMSQALAHSANLVKAPTVPASGASGASLASVDHLQPITGVVVKQGAGDAVGNYVKLCRNDLGLGGTMGRLDYLSISLEHLQICML